MTSDSEGWPVQDVVQPGSRQEAVYQRGDTLSTRKHEVPDELLDQLLANCQKPEGLIGENGLLKQLTKRLLKRALDVETTAHLGHERQGSVANASGCDPVRRHEPPWEAADGSIYLSTMSHASQHENEHEHESDHGVLIAPARPEVRPPPLYRVLLLNDDYTPMDFVVEVLQVFFSMNRERATQVMLHVHTRGQGVCGVFTREVAETKVEQVNGFSRTHQHPLLCTMEPA